jgi:hypothetical protein
MSFFSFTKSGNRRTEEVLPGETGTNPMGGDRKWGKSVGR